VLPRRLTIRARRFERVCVRRTGVGVYRGDETYLRIGPGLGEELATQRRLVRDGFPVPRLLESGFLGRAAYLVERSLGPLTLGEVFLAEREEHGSISDRSFGVFADVMERHARAQVRTSTARWSVRGFADLIGVEGARALRPEIADEIRAAFTDAVSRVRALPGSLVHGDLHPHNVCAGGVIDLEGTGRGVAAYDVATAAFVPAMCGVAGSPSWFTSSQLAGYLHRTDAVFEAGGLRPVSECLDALLLCRAISLCARRPRHERAWLARTASLDAALLAWRSGEPLATRWGLGRS
jgi:hypothetical protein